MPLFGETGWQGFTLLSPALIYTLQNIVIFLESSVSRFPGTGKPDTTSRNQKLFCHFADGAPQVTKKNQWIKKIVAPLKNADI